MVARNPLRLIFATALVLSGCSVTALGDLTGYACESDGGCAEGYTCDELNDVCITDGNACSDEGRESPCTYGATDCSEGCRTCTDGVWTECVVEDCSPATEIPCNGVDEDCDGSDATESGTDTNCSACGDTCGAGNGVATASCDASGSAPLCVVDTCDAGLRDADDDYTNGCEATCVPDNGGVETCDGGDNDCNGSIDDITDADADCNGQVPSANVVDWECTAGSCVVVTCDPDQYDVDLDWTNGCEYACLLTNGGVETCEGSDDDCNGVIDDVIDPTTDCATIHAAATDVVSFTCESPVCAVEVCVAGMSDDNGDPADGCEAVCVDTGVEACDGTDNDCNGYVDDAQDGAAGCSDFYLDADLDGFGLTAEVRCMCDEDGQHTATVDGDCDDTTDQCTTDCSDSDGDTVADCIDDCVDTDGDGLGDGAFDTSGCDDPTADSDDSVLTLCADTDADGCDDCSLVRWNPADDGADGDADGICDLSDTCSDADGDGLGDGTLGNTSCVVVDDDSDDTNASVCADIDRDTCEDCLSGLWDTNNDGTDTDGDGICDAAPPCTDDADGDGLGDGTNFNIGCLLPDNDSNDADEFICIDTDADGCDDCSVLGSYDPTNDGIDTDGDTICDVGDICAAGDDTIDTDGDTIPDDCDPCPGTEIAGSSCGICQACDGAGNCLEDITLHGDCPVCQQCLAADSCGVQNLSDDLKNECTADACNTGACDGAGACGFETNGTDCGDCLACDGAGGCIDDLTQNADCPLCERCAAGGTCTDQASGDDIKLECDNGTFCDGDEVCDGAGVCMSPGDPCGGGLCNETNDTCGCDTDFDCPLCQQCQGAPGGTCIDQIAGNDGKDECTQDSCNTGDCDGGGACEFEPNTVDCGQCLRCDGLGACNDDLSQDTDCGFCEECGAGGSCVDQTGTDVKNQCTADDCNTGDCDGAGACGFVAATTACTDDSLYCTGVEECDGAGACLGTGDPCSGAECNTCNEAGNSCFTPIGTVCTDDSTYCNGPERCDGAGACAGTGDPCATNGPCNNTCNEGPDNCFVTAGTSCTDDGFYCNGAEECNGAGFCAGIGDPCAAGSECNDACNESVDDCFTLSGVACTANANYCDGVEECNGAGACTSPGDPCVGGPECDDACDEGNDNCYVTGGTSCTTDGLFCNGPEECNGNGSCAGTGDPCPGTTCENCDETGDDCFDPPTVGCNDGIGCTVGDNCDDAGGCASGVETDAVCPILGQVCEPGCSMSPSGCVAGADADGDGVPNLCDICWGDDASGDADSDGACDDVDTNDSSNTVCLDTDADGCDDCSSTSFDPANDGTDNDSDGYCSDFGVDCNDDPGTCGANCNPGVGAEACDGFDNNCDNGGTPPANEIDDDGDGYIECAFFLDRGAGLTGGLDCDDDPAVCGAACNPGLNFDICDSHDNDCDSNADGGCSSRFAPVMNNSNSSLVNDTVVDLAVDASGNLWVACDGAGEASYLPTQGGTFSDITGLRAYVPWKVIIDSSGNAWFSYDENGNCDNIVPHCGPTRVSPDRTQFDDYNSETPLSTTDNEIRAMVEDPDTGMIFMASSNDYTIYKPTPDALICDIGVPGNVVYEVELDNSSPRRVFGGRATSMYECAQTDLDPPAPECNFTCAARDVYTGNDNIQVLEFDDNTTPVVLTDDFMWIGSWTGGVALWDLTGNTTLGTWDDTSYPTNGIPNNDVQDIAIYRSGTTTGDVYVGTPSGLPVYDVSTFPGLVWTVYTSATGLPADNVTALAADPARNRLWIGTTSGITWTTLH